MDIKDGAVVGAISGMISGLMEGLIFIRGFGAIMDLISSQLGSITGRYGNLWIYSIPNIRGFKLGFWVNRKLIGVIVKVEGYEKMNHRAQCSVID